MSGLLGDVLFFFAILFLIAGDFSHALILIAVWVVGISVEAVIKRGDK